MQILSVSLRSIANVHDYSVGDRWADKEEGDIEDWSRATWPVKAQRQLLLMF